MVKHLLNLFGVIINFLHLLNGQGHRTQGSINQRQGSEDVKAQLQVLHATLKQIETEAGADRALKKKELRLEGLRLWIEVVTLLLVIFGTAAAIYNLKLLKDSMHITEQQVRAMYSTMQIQQRAYVNVLNIEKLSLEVGKRPVASVSYKNSGLTPANYIWIVPDSILSEFAPPPIKEKYLSCPLLAGSGPTLPPGVTRTVNTSRMIGPVHAGQGQLGVLTDKFIHDMSHMKAIWYVVVYIVYIDSFGHCHDSVEPFEFDPFTQTFTPSLLGARPDWIDTRHTKN